MTVSRIKTTGGTSPKRSIFDQYNDFCERQKGKEFLWYSIAFITLIGSIMPASLMAMYFTPWFFPFVFVSMLLFFANVICVIGRASMKTIISVYFLTVACNILVPALSHLILTIIG